MLGHDSESAFFETMFQEYSSYEMPSRLITWQKCKSSFFPEHNPRTTKTGVRKKTTAQKKNPTEKRTLELRHNWKKGTTTKVFE